MKILQHQSLHNGKVDEVMVGSVPIILRLVHAKVMFAYWLALANDGASQHPNVRWSVPVHRAGMTCAMRAQRLRLQQGNSTGLFHHCDSS